MAITITETLQKQGQTGTDAEFRMKTLGQSIF